LLIRPDARLNCVNRWQTERVIAEILKPVGFQEAEKPVGLKKHDAHELAIYTPKRIGERTLLAWTSDSEF